MAYRKWAFAEYDAEKTNRISEEFNIEPLVAHILLSRGVDSSVEIAKFLSDSYESVSPYHFADMEEAEFAVGNAIDCGEKICIYGDYDCDGITATAILYSYLQSEGADVFYYIPHRVNEGYGINKAAVDYIHNQGADLIITVDNGISSVEEAEYIYSLGMRLVVTDHHQLGDTLPRAEAVVNPHRPENELTFREYCGAGVAFKLICALCQGDDDEMAARYMDLVAIATVADVVSLHGENRSFVKRGLKLINENPRPALRAFLENMRSPVSSGEISFQIAPRINAVGRLDDARPAVEFLLCEDLEECRTQYQKLCRLNDLRKQEEDKILRSVEEQIQKNKKLALSRVVVIAGAHYHKGIVGIVASRVLQKYGKPVIILGVDDDGIARGSARSVEGFHIYNAIHACRDDLIQYGGHPGAAGVTLKAENVDAFRRHINEYAMREYDVMPPDVLHIDFALALSKVNLKLVDTLKVFEPYGEQNSMPVIELRRVTVSRVYSPVKNGEKVNYTLFDFTKKDCTITGKIFGIQDTDATVRVDDVVDAAVEVGSYRMNGRDCLSVKVIAMRRYQADDDRFFAEKDSYEKYLLGYHAPAQLLPSRDDFATVYRFLKQNQAVRYDIVSLYFQLQNRISYGKLCIILAAFCQGGLAQYKEERIVLLGAAKKVNLENTKVMQTLKGRIHNES